MIHFVLHDAKDTVAVVVVEGVKAGMEMTGWIMDEDKMTNVVGQAGHPDRPQGGAEGHGRGDTVVEVRHRHGQGGRADQGRRTRPRPQHQDQAVVMLTTPEAADAAPPQGGTASGPAKPVPRRLLGRT